MNQGNIGKGPVSTFSSILDEKRSIRKHIEMLLKLVYPALPSITTIIQNLLMLHFSLVLTIDPRIKYNFKFQI